MAVYDILLRALTIQRQQLADRLAHAINYADDLKSIAGNLASLQEQANLVSAFALVCGLDQSKTKFRAFRFPFDIPEDQREQLPAMDIKVHKQGWQTDSVSIQSIGTLKDLGYHLDTDLGGEQQFKITLQRLTTALEAMKYKFQGSPGKEYTMRMVVMPRLAYTGQGANLAEAHIKRLDSVTLAYARKDLRLMAGFPTAPLIHHQLINYPLPSSIYYEARLGSLWRNLGREGRPADIVQEHLDRALRTRGMDATVAQPLRIQEVSTVDHSNYWINGLLQGLARSELYLNRGGAPTLSPTTRQIITGSPGTEGLLSQLRRWGINTWADLLTPEGTLTIELRQLSSLPLTLPAGLTIEPPLLHQGQFWYRTDCHNGITTVIKIMNVTPT